MRNIIILFIVILWFVGGCAAPDAAYKARLGRLIEVSDLMDKGVEHYHSKGFYDKEIEQLDRRYEKLEGSWRSYSSEPMKDEF